MTLANGDPTYVRAEIEDNPIWRRAFQLSELENDNAPIGWGAYIKRAYQEMQSEASVIVRDYARLNAPAALESEVTAICKAIGEISIDEAKAAVVRIHNERMERLTR